MKNSTFFCSLIMISPTTKFPNFDEIVQEERSCGFFLIFSFKRKLIFLKLKNQLLLFCFYPIGLERGSTSLKMILK